MTRSQAEYIFSDPGFEYGYTYDCGWNGPGWYFWDETGAYCYGPYGSAQEANEACSRYAKTL